MHQTTISNLNKWVVEKVISGQGDGYLTETEFDFLNQLDDRETFNTLYTISCTESNKLLQSKAFQAILSLDEVDKANFLIMFFDQTTTWGWKCVCCRAMAKYQDQRVLSKLCTILFEDEDPDVRYVAAEALGENGDVSVVACLEHAVVHDKGQDWEGFAIAKAAQSSLEQIRQRIA